MRLHIRTEKGPVVTLCLGDSSTVSEAKTALLHSLQSDIPLKEMGLLANGQEMIDSELVCRSAQAWS